MKGPLDRFAMAQRFFLAEGNAPFSSQPRAVAMARFGTSPAIVLHHVAE
jgi:hypothetical protein